MAIQSQQSGKVKTTVKDVEVIRQGTQIILPLKMDWDEGIEWLRRKRDEDEKDVGVHYELPYSPLDGAVAFHKALAHTYGWADLVPTPGFWGDTPPTMIGVPISVSERQQVPWGRVQVPGVAGFLQTSLIAEPVPRFVINGKVKKKHENEIKKLVDLTESFLREGSIYKGQAIKVSYEWQREGNDFDPSEHCPHFISLAGTSEADLIFGEEVENALNIGLFTPIEQADACRRYSVPLKRGVLLYGPYGVGKSLTANVTALKAGRNGFTFIYLDSVLDLKKGLQFAAQYAPAVVFAEDIDRCVNGDRSLSMDEILNTLDGVDTKGGEIITVFTTNHVEKINPALLRMGRLDTLVEIKEPDAAAAIRLVHLYGRGLFAADVDYTKVGEVLKGNIPAFIREVVERAKIAAIARLHGGEIRGQVLEADLLAAASAMRTHAEMLKPAPAESKDTPEMLLRIPNGHKSAAAVLNSLGVRSNSQV